MSVREVIGNNAKHSERGLNIINLSMTAFTQDNVPTDFSELLLRRVPAVLIRSNTARRIVLRLFAVGPLVVSDLALGVQERVALITSATSFSA